MSFSSTLNPPTFQDYEARIGALKIDLVGKTECRSGSNNANGLNWRPAACLRYIAEDEVDREVRYKVNLDSDAE